MFIQQSTVKQMQPEALASGMVKQHGPIDAAKILHREKRPMIGVKADQPNPNKSYFVNAYNWVLNRFPFADVKKSEGKDAEK